MKRQKRHIAAAAFVTVASICSGTAVAQDDLEEITVTGRFITSSQQLVNERLSKARHLLKQQLISTENAP